MQRQTNENGADDDRALPQQQLGQKHRAWPTWESLFDRLFGRICFPAQIVVRLVQPVGTGRTENI